MKTFFTSDLHFYHKNILSYCNRPYKDVEHMNEMLVKNWNEVVSPDDLIYCLGDFSLAIRPVELFTHRLNGFKILVSGNHDWTHSTNKKARNPERKQNMIEKYKNFGWANVCDTLVVTHNGLTYNLSHFPYKGDFSDERFQNHRLYDDGNILLCGHVHEKWATRRSPSGTLMINVGVDVRDYKPISIDEIDAIARKEIAENPWWSSST